MANDSTESDTSTDVTSSDIEGLENYPTLELNIISNKENQELDATVPHEDVHPNVYAEINPDELQLCTDAMSDTMPIDNNADGHVGNESGCENTHEVGETVSDQVTSVEEAQNYGDERGELNYDDGSKTMVNRPCDNSHDHAQDKEWVLVAAAILKKIVEGKEWAEIINRWVLLQQIWEKNKVRSFQTDSDCVPEKLTLRSRPIAKVI